MASPGREPLVSVTERLPPANARVIVVRREFRCLGYVDEQGVWRDAAKSEKRDNAIAWLDFMSAIAPPGSTPRPPRSDSGLGML